LTDINNDDVLLSVSSDIAEQIIDIVSDRIYKKLRWNIMQYVYAHGGLPNKIYENDGSPEGQRMPSFEFMDAFHWDNLHWENLQVASTSLTRELFYDWSGMTVNPSTGRHYQEGTDTREALADFLNIDGVFGFKERLPFWDITISEIDSEIDSYFKDAISLLGIQIV
jgi:hypothetical protein